MRNTRVLVIAVSRPVVAHSEGQWEVTVIYAEPQRNGYVKKVKKNLFCNFQPRIGQWINARLI